MIELSEVEQSVLDGAFVEAQRAILEHQQMLKITEQKREGVIAATGASSKVMRAVLTLKGLNPDAYTGEWNEQTNHLSIIEKEPVASPFPETPPLLVPDPVLIHENGNGVSQKKKGKREGLSLSRRK